MQQNLGSAAKNIDKGPQNPSSTHPPSELASTAPPPVESSSAEEIDVETEETIVNSPTNLSEQCTALLASTHDAKTVEHARAMADFNQEVDEQSQTPQMQAATSELLNGDNGHWIKQCLDSHSESQHLETTDIAKFLNSTCDADTIDEHLQCRALCWCMGDLS
jgi:hypothetical protein